MTTKREIVERDADGRLDLSRLRAGAEVTFVASEVDAPRLADRASTTVFSAQIVRYTVEPEPIRTGDKVLHISGFSGTLVGLHRGHAWLDTMDGALLTVTAENLEKIS